MARLARKHPTSSDVSRSRLTVVLLVLVSVAVLGLVWQAYDTARSNRATATRVLQDYARLVNDEFVRRSMAQVGYYGYNAELSAFGRQLSASPDALDTKSDIARYRFSVDTRNMRVDAAEPLDANVEEYLLAQAATIATQAEPESGMTIIHATIDGQARSFGFSSVDELVFGFEVERSALAAQLRQVFNGKPLLPESLAGGVIGNDSLYMRIEDHGGSTLFESGPFHDPYLLVTKTIDDGYSGVFTNFTVAAAIDPAMADKLVIGGLPASRLPILIITVLLTLALLVAAILQLRREYALMNLRNDFVSEVSHELRTPLTQIRMFAETLIHERFDNSDDRRRALNIINRESQRLIHLVENVLRFSGQNGHRQTLSIAHDRLAPLVERVVEEFRPIAEAAGSTLSLEVGPHAEADFDADAVRRILLNLLDNAVKYGPEEQRIRVALTERQNAVRLSVCDQGHGIPADAREKIWGGYYRLEREHASAIAGTGIGLAVVRELATQLNGSAWVEEAEGGGACFSVELPNRPVTK